MKKIIIISVALILVVLAVLRLKATHDKNSSQKGAQLSLNVVSVNTAIVKRISNEGSLSLVGTLSTDKEISIAAEAQGRIISLNCETGQYKEKGSVIAQIDDKMKQLTLQSAKITLDKAKKDFARTESLYKGGTSSEQELDNARTTYENAKNQVEQAEKQLAYTKVLAPISGIITVKSAEAGSYVNIGSPVVQLVNVSKLKVKINVSETVAYSLKKGDMTNITADVFPGATFSGRISYVSPSGDASHNYPVEVEISNNTKHPLKAGTFVNVKIDLPSSGMGLYIPRQSLLGSITNASVYVAENGIAKLRKITVGSQNNEYLEVISGLNENETVVTSGQINLTEGKPIKIINK
jgi:membrane fusion protein, multidrug efflux system